MQSEAEKLYGIFCSVYTGNSNLVDVDVELGQVDVEQLNMYKAYLRMYSTEVDYIKTQEVYDVCDWLKR